MTEPTMTVRERVTNGAALLDRHAPGWRGQVRTASLRMASMDVCVLGQVFGEYFTGLDALRLNKREAHVYGFDIDPVAIAIAIESGMGVLAEYQDLDSEWRKVITAGAV